MSGDGPNTASGAVHKSLVSRPDHKLPGMSRSLHAQLVCTSGPPKWLYSDASAG